MEIVKTIPVPTGHIYIGKGDKGLLEFLSIGDYGKERNIKADFMGLTRPINGVENGNMKPLSEKWVITVSTQYGCSMGCTFCDVPKVGPGVNATVDDLFWQVVTAVKQHPEITHTKRLNVHFARMGEPTFNNNVLKATTMLAGYFKALGWHFHPVVSTMLPNKNNFLWEFIQEWLWIKNEVLHGEAGLQLSINSTDAMQRAKLFNSNSTYIGNVPCMLEETLRQCGLKGRKIALNFAVTDETIIDAEFLRALFDPKYFMCKLTPIHVTRASQENGLKTSEGYTQYYPYAKHEEALKAAGFDVIVFIPSQEEDESRITCGNAILSDK